MCVMKSTPYPCSTRISPVTAVHRVARTFPRVQRRGGIHFRDYGITETPHIQLARCVDHRDRAQTARRAAGGVKKGYTGAAPGRAYTAWLIRAVATGGWMCACRHRDRVVPFFISHFGQNVPPQK